MIKLDVLLLKHFGTQAADIGNYAAAQNLAYAPTFFTASITILLIASLSKFEHDGRSEKTGAVAEQTFKIIAWLFPICALVAGSRVEVISFIFGPGYEQAAEIISILVFASIPLLIIQTSSGIFMAKSKPALAALLIFPAPLIYLVVGLICRNYFSLKGAAIFMVLSLAAAALINMFVIHQKWHIRYSPKSLIINILIAICVFMAGNLIQANGIFLVAELIITAVFIILALSVTGEIPREILTSLKRKE